MGFMAMVCDVPMGARAAGDWQRFCLRAGRGSAAVMRASRMKRWVRGNPLAFGAAAPALLWIGVGCGASDVSREAPLSWDGGSEAWTDTGADEAVDVVVSDGEKDAVTDAGEDGMVEGATDARESGIEPMVTVLSLNLHCFKVEGTQFASNEGRFAAIAQGAAAEAVDAIAVQEACVRTGADAMDMLAGALAAATGQTWQAAWQPTHVAWQGTPDEAMEGVGLLVRGMITDVQPIVYRIPGVLARAAISGVMGAGAGGIRVVSTHLDYGDAAARAAQARETASATMAMADPSLAVVVAGDFNAVVGSSTHQTMIAFGFEDLTASLDPSRIDHVFAHRGAGLEVQYARTMFDGTDYPVVSDHHGVLVRARVVTAPGVTRTRIRVHSSGADWVAVRGDTLPLTWQEGVPLFQDGDAWRLVVTEWAAGQPVEVKCLRSDTTWESGDNHVVLGGDTVDLTPSF